MNPVAALRPSAWLAAALLLAGACASLALLRIWYLREYVFVSFASFAIYASAVWLCLSGRLHAPGRERAALWLILGVAVTLRLIALAAPQSLSTDIFRYVWDGRVQAAGINPYLFIPIDDALAGLRDAAIFPNINRADYAHTIYPPAAQLFFRGIAHLHGGVLAMKLGLTACEGLTIYALLALLRQHRLPATRVLIYAWHPLPVWEFAGSGHVDALMIALMMLALLLASRRRPFSAGALLGSAVLVKLFPLALVPALLRLRDLRRVDWRLPLGLLVAIALLYWPYLGAGRAVFGFLSGYADEEGLRDGSGFFIWALLRGLVPVAQNWNAALLYPAAALVALGALALIVLRRQDPRPVSLPGALMLATAFVVAISPHLAWYFAWLIPLLCFKPSPAVFWLTGAAPILYLLPWYSGLAGNALIYAPFALLLLVALVQRQRLPFPETPDVDPVRNQPAT